MTTKEVSIEAKTISGIIVHFLNTQFAALILVGLLVWGLSKFSDEQIDSLERIIQVSDNWIGRMWFGLICFFFFYALVVYPTGKFLANIMNSWTHLQSTHHTDSLGHIAASKQMYHMLSDMNTKFIEHDKRVWEVIDRALPALDKIVAFFANDKPPN